MNANFISVEFASLADYSPSGGLVADISFVCLVCFVVSVACCSVSVVSCQGQKSDVRNQRPEVSRRKADGVGARSGSSRFDVRCWLLVVGGPWFLVRDQLSEGERRAAD